MSPLTTGPGAAGSSGSEPSTGWTTGWQRLSQTFLRPPSGGRGAPAGHERPDVSRMTDDEKRALITTVDPKEARIGLLAAVLAIALALATVLPYMVSRKWVVSTSVKPTNKSCPTGFRYATSAGKAVCEVVYPASHYTLDLIVPLVFAVAILVTVRIRRRAPLAFTTLMTGLALGEIYLLVPFAIAGGWLMLRAWRAQKYGAPDVKAPLPGWVPPPRASTRRARSTGPGRAASGRQKNGTAPGARKPPSANKRYTPKAPPKKKVTPPA